MVPSGRHGVAQGMERLKKLNLSLVGNKKWRGRDTRSL